MSGEPDIIRAASWAQDGVPFVCITVTHVGGSTPRLEGAQMWVSDAEQVGTVGGGAFEQLVVQEARALLSAPAEQLTREVSAHLTHELGMCCGGKMSALLRRYLSPTPLYVFGAGHVAQALTQHLSLLSLHQVHVIDERPEWLSAERFSASISLHLEEPESWLRGAPLPHGSIALIMTHDHQLDERVLSLLLPQLERGALRYLGMIGSAGKWGRFKRRLKARGASDEGLDRVHCPVGLPIYAQSPHEIAISVCAELITQARRPRPEPEPLRANADQAGHAGQAPKSNSTLD